MAIYHLNLTTGSKGGGKSAGAKSDYITREGKYKLGKEELLTQIHGNLPSFAENEPSYFWQSADKYEAENGRLYIQIEFALPRELNNEQQIKLAQKFTDEICNTNTYNLPYTLAIHKGEYDHKGRKSKSEPTPHCHLIISERGIDNIDRTAEVFFKRANPKNPELGGAKKVRVVKSKEWLKHTRELWANLANQELEKAGFSERIDHRTLLEQGITDREPKSKIYWNDNQNLDKEIEQEELKKLSAEELSLIEEITKIDNEISELSKSEVLADKLTYFAQEYKNIQQKELTEQSKEFLKTSISQEYEKGGEQAVSEYINNYLTILKTAKEKAIAEAEVRRQAEEEAREKALEQLLKPNDYFKGGEYLNDLEAKDLETLEHLGNFQHLDNLEVINYEVSENRTNTDSLRDLPSRTSNENPATREQTDRGEKANNKNPLSSQPSIDLGHRQTKPNGRVQPLGESTELSYEVQKDNFIKKLLSNPTITYEVVLSATQSLISDYLSKKATNNSYQTKIDELTSEWRDDVVRGRRLKEYEEAQAEIKLIKKLWSESEKHNFWERNFYQYTYKGVFRTWKEYRKELKKCFSEYREIVIKYEKDLKTAQEGKEKITPELEKSKERLSIYAEMLRIKAREKYGFTQDWERSVIQKKGLSTKNEDIIKTLQKLSYYKANPQELEPKVITRTISQSRGRSR